MLVPLKNQKDIDDLEKEIVDGIIIKYVQHAEEVFREVLLYFINIIKINSLGFARLGRSPCIRLPSRQAVYK